MTDLAQVKLSLSPELVAYVQAEAARTDRTPSGYIRHVLAEHKRTAPPSDPGGCMGAHTLPNIPATPEGIAAAEAIISDLEAEETRLVELQNASPPRSTATNAARLDRLRGDLIVLRQRYVMACRMLPRAPAPAPVVARPARPPKPIYRRDSKTGRIMSPKSVATVAIASVLNRAASPVAASEGGEHG
jgi:hypothetical protein